MSACPLQQDEVTREWLRRDWTAERSRLHRLIVQAERQIEYINTQLAKLPPQSTPDELPLFPSSPTE